MRYKRINQWSRLFPVLALFGVLLLAAPLVEAQDQQAASNVDGSQVAASNSATIVTPEKALSLVMPVFTNYKGVTIGMSANEVRQKLDRMKEKGEKQDLFVFSDAGSVQVHYDADKKVSAVSIDYLGDDSGAPVPEAVVGKTITPRSDGSMYELVRYPEAGYWVAYSRTAGSNPIITVTMQKI